MIYYVATERFSSTVRHFLRAVPQAAKVLKPLTYEELFFERAGPIGHYIFTDFDRLTRFELECAASFCVELAKVAPQARILNHPLRSLERFPLLIALHKAGINDFTAIRVETGARPAAYPAFIRAEDGYGGPETDLIGSDDEYDRAVQSLADRNLPARGRIAIGYAAERREDGFFRKYGAFNIGGQILPHHIQRNKAWVVKKDIVEHDWTIQRDHADRVTESAIAEEIAYVRDNPHREILARAFAIANIDFGRIDYGIVNGRVQVYEINTNPSMPGRMKQDARAAIRQMTRPRMLEALALIDTPSRFAGRVRFSDPRPRMHDVRVPRWTLPASLLRRAADRFHFGVVPPASARKSEE